MTSLMNRLNKTESAVFKLWMLYFQRTFFYRLFMAKMLTQLWKTMRLIVTSNGQYVRGRQDYYSFDYRLYPTGINVYANGTHKTYLPN